MMKLVEISPASARAAVDRGLIVKLFDSDATAWQCLDPNDGSANDAQRARRRSDHGEVEGYEEENTVHKQRKDQ
jgi:hypothetical protein